MRRKPGGMERKALPEFVDSCKPQPFLDAPRIGA
jgi:hypothetical protein